MQDAVHELTPLQQRDEIMAFRFAAGTSVAELAAIYGMSQAGIRARLESAAVQQRLAHIRARVQAGMLEAEAVFRTYLPEIAQKLCTLALSSDDRVAGQNARAVMQLLMPKVSVIETRNETAGEDSPAAQVVRQFAETIDRMRRDNAIDITTSRHVLSANEACPQAVPVPELPE